MKGAPTSCTKNVDGGFLDKAVEYGVDDTLQNGRGTALADIMYSAALGSLSVTGTATTAHMCQCRTAFWILLRMNSESRRW